MTMFGILGAALLLALAASASAASTDGQQCIGEQRAVDCEAATADLTNEQEQAYFCSDRFIWEWSEGAENMLFPASDALALTLDAAAAPGLDDTVVVVFQGCNQEFQLVSGFCSELSSKTQIFNPVTQEWSLGEEMPTLRYRSAAVNVSEHILVFGGRNAPDDELLCNVDVFNVATGEWSTLPTEWTNCTSDAAGWASDDGSVYISGGYFANYTTSDQTFQVAIEYGDNNEVVDVSFTEVAPMSQTRGDHRCWAVYGTDYAYCMGGYTLENFFEEALDSMEMYSFSQDRWVSQPSMATGRGDFALAFLNGRIHVIGGEVYDLVEQRPVGVKTIEWYDYKIDCWTSSSELFDLPYPRFRFPAASYLTDSRIFVFGGQSDPTSANSANEPAWPITGDTFWFQERPVQTLEGDSDAANHLLSSTLSFLLPALALAVCM
jgi:hypothetical protein